MQKLWLLVSINEFKEKQPEKPRQELARLREGPLRDYPKDFQIRIQCQKFTSLAELEEVANESLKKDSTNQYMIFEAISVMEIIPTNPICKKFNENGELLI